MEISREDVIRCFPIVEEIKDETLREQVISTWIEVAKDAPYERLEDCAFGPQLPELSLVEHVRGVAEISLAFADVMEREHGVTANRDMLIAMALLHDVSKSVEFYRDEQGNVHLTEQGKMFEHAFIGAAVAYKNGLPTELVHCINGHSPYSPVEPKTLETAILCIADLANFDILSYSKGILTRRLQKNR